MNLVTDYFVSKDYMFQDKSSVYLFSNENIGDVVLRLGDLYGQRVLSVCASGDLVFAAYASGARSVDTFDVNSYQYAISELKLHMIKHVSYENFMDFFFSESNFFNPKILNPIRDKFSKTLTDFIDDYTVLRGESLLRERHVVKQLLETKTIPFVGNKSVYDALGDKIANDLNFKHCHLGNIADNFEQKYDLIYLSNIYDYVAQGNQKIDAFESFYFSYLLFIADSLLSDAGRIVFRYRWNSSHAEIVAWQNYFELSFSKKYKYEFKLIAVDGARSKKHTDLLFVLCQKPKVR